MMRNSLAILFIALAMTTAPLHAETITFGGAAVGSPPNNFELSRTGEGGPARWAVPNA
jgi:hypothetical protein